MCCVVWLYLIAAVLSSCPPPPSLPPSLDTQKIMLQSGVAGKQVVFLFTDTQIVNESLLEDINNVLNTGEVPNLWEVDEVNKIIEDLRPVCVAQGFPDTRDNVYRLFVARVRDNMHIVLAMSPVGDSFRVRYVQRASFPGCLRVYLCVFYVAPPPLCVWGEKGCALGWSGGRGAFWQLFAVHRCRQFPSLINCTTIDWFMPWPDEALFTVANRFLAEEDLGGDEVGVCPPLPHPHPSPYFALLTAGTFGSTPGLTTATCSGYCTGSPCDAGGP